MAAILSGAALLLSTGVLKGSKFAFGDFDGQARNYLLENPDVFVEALRSFDEQQQVAEADELKTILRERHEEIFNDSLSPVLGNPPASWSRSAETSCLAIGRPTGLNDEPKRCEWN